jgi:hypothetical protein
VRTIAGVPVNVPAGAVRLTFELETTTRAWGSRVVVGLFREVGGGLVPEPRPLEGMGTVLHLWQVSTHPEDDSRVIGSGVGPLAGPDQQPRIARTRDAPFVRWLRPEHQFRLKLRFTIEHDPLTRWTRVTVDDLESGDRLVDEQGDAPLALPTGPYLLGLCSLGENGRDLAGVGWAPETEISVPRIRFQQVNGHRGAWEPVAGFIDLVQGRDEPRRTACGRIALGMADGTERLQALADREGEDRARLLLQLGATLARTGDAEKARARIADAARADPLGLLRGFEDDGPFLSDEAAAAARDALATVLIETTASDEASLLRKAVLHRLRGELRECLDCCAKLPASEARAYVRLSAVLTAEFQAELGRYPARTALPECVYPLRCYWKPLEPMAPEALDRALRARLDKAFAEDEADPQHDHGASLWLERWIQLSPRRTDLLLLRYTRERRPDVFRWRQIRDLEKALVLDPKSAAASFYLGFERVRDRDDRAASRLLRAACDLGEANEVRKTLDEWVRQRKAAKDVARFEKLRAEVLEGR